MTAVTAEGLWVAVRDDGASHRGGTVTIDSSEPDSIDPGVSYDGTGWAILSVTNDGLVGFKRTGRVEGATLVPNLATELPTPTDGGMTYTFQLRPDVSYSTGAPVRASDVRASIERTLRFDGAPGYFFEAIRGASACTSKHCDLSKGIAANDATGTVAFHLKVPDPDFLHQLATPFASILPAHTPKATGSHSVPATGPYVIANYEPGRQLELARNRHFEVWSNAAQPQGNVDEIVYRLAVNPRKALSLVSEGRADIAWDVVDGEEIATRYPERAKLTVSPGTWHMSLNNRVPPFNDLSVRRAVNYAIDRERILDFFGGPNAARITCQVLPPGFPSYEPYCPYTSDPSADGEWKGPDLERARDLIAASGTKGMKVTAWFAGPGPGMVDYFVSLLTDLGFVADFKVFGCPCAPYFNTVGDSRTRAQIAFGGWFSDYPAPSNFFEPVLTCDSFVPRDAAGANQNIAGFCDKHIDSLIARAGELQASDPAAARALWTRIDAKIVDRAPWIPLVNPSAIQFLSERVGNFQYQIASGVLLEQLWVR